MRSLPAFFAALSVVSFTSVSAQESDGGAAVQFLDQLTSDSDWTLTESVALKFNAHHPQGMTRIGDSFYLTAVETTVRPERVSTPGSVYDRTAGAGTGHLFKFDLQGNLQAAITLGEGSIYHPGGMDYDGKHLWIPVAEYRPDSHAIVYRVEPASLAVDEVFRFDDHLGGLLRNPEDGTVYGLSWGSRKLYRWSEVNGSYDPTRTESKIKLGSDVDYQDCQLLSARAMLCSGMGSLPIDNTHVLTIGGLELVDLDSLEVTHKIRVTGTAPGGELLTRNPFWFELNENQRGAFYFVPEDEQATLYHYSTAQP